MAARYCFELGRTFGRTWSACQQLLIPFFQLGRLVWFRRLLKPLHDSLIGRVGLNRSRELVAGNSDKLHQPFVYWTRVDVFPLCPCEHSSAFVDHAGEVGIARQLESHAAREVFP